MRSDITSMVCLSCSENLLPRVQADGESSATAAHAFHHNKKWQEAFDDLMGTIRQSESLELIRMKASTLRGLARSPSGYQTSRYA